MLTLTLVAFGLFLQLVSYDYVHDAQRKAAEYRNSFLFAAISMGVFASIWVFHRIVQAHRRNRPGTAPDAVTSRPNKFLSYVFLTLAFACAAVGAYVGYLKFTEGLPSTAWALMASLTYLCGYLGQQAQRLATPLAEDVLSHDTRAPVLFLRSFSEEEMEFNQNRLWGLPRSFELPEEAVLNVFRRIGPVVALTNPKLGRRPTAYAPYDTLSTQWETRVDDLLERAAVIALVVAKSEGIGWEIRRIKDKNYLSRTIFIFPPVDAEDVADRLEWLKEELGLHDEKVYRKDLGQPLLMRFVDDQVRLYREPPDSNGYAKAIKRSLIDPLR